MLSGLRLSFSTVEISLACELLRAIAEIGAKQLWQVSYIVEILRCLQKEIKYVSLSSRAIAAGAVRIVLFSFWLILCRYLVGISGDFKRRARN